MADPQVLRSQGHPEGGQRTAQPAEIPVRRFGSVPDLDDEELEDARQDPAASARTIAETGAAAVWLAALLAGCVAGYLLYVH